MARKILLADDSVTAQNMGRKILTEAGYEVITVNNGSSALKKATEARPDLIILDVYMPGYGGLEVCQRIKDTPESARIPILLSVGKLEPFKADEARRAGADAHIVKPFEASELLAAINKLEDRIVPQGTARRPGRSTRIAIEDGSELRDGWKDRLPTPISKGKRPTTDWDEPEGPTPPEAKPAETKAVETKTPAAQAESPKDTPPREDFAVVSSAPESGKAEDEPSETAAAEAAQTPVATQAPAAPEAPAVPAAETTPLSEPAGASERTGSLAESEVAAALATLGGNDQAVASPIGRTFMPDDAATILGPRWIAEEVSLTDDEANCILEREMEKALAAIAAAEAASAEPASYQEMVRISQASEAQSGESSLVDASEPLVGEMKTQEPVPSSEENVAVEAVAHAIEPAAITASLHTENVAANAPPLAAAQELAAYAAAASSSGTFESSASQRSTMPEPGSQAATLAASSSGPACAETDSEPKFHEAGANWKQIREFAIGSQLTEHLAETADSQIPDSQSSGVQFPDLQFTGVQFKDIRRETPVSAPQAQPPEEASAADADEAAAIASVVDSVLADLKPKLMEELARKMRKGKK